MACWSDRLNSGRASIEPRSGMLMMVLLLSLMGMSTVVMGNRVQRRLQVVTTPEAENTTREQVVQPNLSGQASNSTSCDHENTDADDLLNEFLPCVPAVSIVSTPPTTECCDQLQSNGLTCLCTLFVRYRSRIPRGVVSIRKVTELPRQCGLPIPEGTVCDGISVPSTASSTHVLDSADTQEPITFGWLTFNP